MRTLKMNPEIKAEWLAALRSGNIPQCRKTLRDPYGGRCCLGVLCDIAERHGIGYWKDRDFVCGEGEELEWEYQVLPSAVAKWAGLVRDPESSIAPVQYADVSPMVIVVQEVPGAGGAQHQVAPLAELNDAGVPFPTIADYIEEQL